MKSENPRRSRGFTLIEILVVVIILGIISAIIVPQLQSRDDMKALAAARTLMADVTYAQNRSIALQKMHFVRFDVAANGYDIVQPISPATLITHPVEQTPFQMHFGTAGPAALKDVQIESASLNGQTTLAFDELGAPQAYDSGSGVVAPLTSGSIVLKSGAYHVTISVEPFSGELKIN